jgi:hypothetical protein
MIVLSGVKYLRKPKAVYGEGCGVRERVVEVDDKQAAGNGPVQFDVQTEQTSP